MIGRLWGDVPVVPDADTARRWAREELADPAYHRGKSLLDRILEWIMDLVNRIFGGGQAASIDPRMIGIALLAVIVVVALVALWIAGPVRRSRRTAAERLVFDVEDARTADEMRAASIAAATRGDWHAAVLDRFRALVRGLEERALLEERAGRTAHEVAIDAGAVLPALREELLSASALFDEVCYGDASGSEPSYRALVELDESARASKPQLRAEVDA